MIGIPSRRPPGFRPLLRLLPRPAFAAALTTLLLLIQFVPPPTAAAAETDAIPLDRHGLPRWSPRVWDDAPVRIELPGPEALAELLARVPLRSFHREDVAPSGRGDGGLVFTPRVTAAELSALRAGGYRPAPLPDLDRAGREAAERAWAERAAAAAAGAGRLPVAPSAETEWTYHTNEEVGQILEGIAAAYPGIARSYVWGTSVEGRDLWGLEISDNVAVQEPEPEVRLSSTIHGDEPIGTELLLGLAHLLVDGYGIDPRLTSIVNDVELHLLPMHNPDGNAAGMRQNVYGVDLNRDYPVPTGSIGQERENVAFIEHAAAHSFTASANLHTGSMVVNYPWDHTYDPAEDDDAIVELSLAYSTGNPTMYASTRFPQGIVNGAQWYVAFGTLQDWSYAETGCIDLTVELNDVKWPPASELESFWNDNRESLLAFIEASRCGVSGVVTDAVTGEPVPATVTVAGNSVPAVCDPDCGDYRKLLDDGVWTLLFSAPGYRDTAVAGVATVWGAGATVDVAMERAPRGTIAGRTVDRGGWPVAASVTVRRDGGIVAVAETSVAGGGCFEAPGLPHGDYLLNASAPGRLPASVPVTVSGPQADAGLLTLTAVRTDTIFSDDFESGTGNWIGAWGTTSDAASGAAALHDSPGGDYAADAQDVCLLGAPLDLSGRTFAQLAFQARWSLEPDRDCVQVEVSGDGGATWTPLATEHSRPGAGAGVQPDGEPCYDGDPPVWRLQTADLTPWAGLAGVRLRFVLLSDGYRQRDGFYCDDVLVTAGAAADIPVSAPPAAVAGILGIHPNPFNPAASVRLSIPEAGPARLTVHDVRGRLVRRLFAGELAAGERIFHWDGRTDAGAASASGVYLVRLEAGGRLDVGKMVLVR